MIDAAKIMHITPGRLRRMVKARQIEFVLFDWRSTKVMAIPAHTLKVRAY